MLTCARSVLPRSLQVGAKRTTNIDRPINDCSYPGFVKKQSIVEILMEAMRSHDQMDPNAFVLLNSVLAIGCRNALRKPRVNNQNESRGFHTRPAQYFQCALNRHGQLSNGPPSLLKLQALVSMVRIIRTCVCMKLIKTDTLCPPRS